MRRILIVSVLLIGAALIGFVNADGGSSLKIGDTAPEFKNLPGVDGKAHSLADYKQDVLVFVIMCNRCPVSVLYEDRLIDFTKKYASGDKAKVGLVAINVNNNDQDKLDKMKIRSQEKGFNFPYLYDHSQAIAKKLNAHVTPEFYVFDKKRMLAYWGPMDDNLDIGKVKERYLVPAVEAILAGKSVATTQVKAFGCPVEYDK